MGVEGAQPLQDGTGRGGGGEETRYGDAGGYRARGRRDAAAASRSHRVRDLPVAPAAGAWISPAPDSAIAAAPALSSPAASNHTSRAALIAGNVSVTRVGGASKRPVWKVDTRVNTDNALPTTGSQRKN